MRDFNRSGGNSRGGGRSFGGGGRSFGGGGRGRSERPEMFSATCDQCGKDCEVPFRPSGDKPVYCSDCFETKRDDGGRDSRGGRFESRERRPSFDRGGFRDREEKQMFSAVCDECGQDCEVPFKPSSNKPIFCSKCFESKEGNKSNGGSKGCDCGNLKADIEALNKKLDKIISILEPIKEVKAAKKAIKKEVAEVVKEVKKTAKKVVKKAKEIKEDITE